LPDTLRQLRIGIVQLGQLNRIAKRFGPSVDAIGQRHQLAENGRRLRIEPHGPLKHFQGRGRFLALFERSAGGEHGRRF
jgi:hypothetical protein